MTLSLSSLFSLHASFPVLCIWDYAASTGARTTGMIQKVTLSILDLLSKKAAAAEVTGKLKVHTVHIV